MKRATCPEGRGVLAHLRFAAFVAFGAFVAVLILADGWLYRHGLTLREAAVSALFFAGVAALALWCPVFGIVPTLAVLR